MVANFPVIEIGYLSLVLHDDVAGLHWCVASHCSTCVHNKKKLEFHIPLK